MQYIDGIENYCDTGKSVVTFGKFDGLHKGHQKLISKVQEVSAICQLNSIVCSFDMNRKDSLMTKEERQRHLHGQVDYLVRGVFTESFRHMSAEDFIRIIVKDRFNADYVVVGTDFRFGYGKMGDCRMLEYYSDRYEYRPIVIQKEYYEECSISSTYIKESIQRGNIQRANIMLGYNFNIIGIIEQGKQLPSFNLEWPEDKIVPAKGIYFTKTTIDGIGYYGISDVSDIGIKPMVSEEKKLIIKTNIFGYSGNAYGKKVKLEFLQFHRKEIEFSNVSEQQQCMAHDIICAKKYFGIEE